jgi:exodeoxyribonuclease-3
MKIVTWNVNSLTVRLPQVVEWLKIHQPDVLALQEIKMLDEKFPLAELQALGYGATFLGQKTYNGVAIISRLSASEIQKGIPHF